MTQESETDSHDGDRYRAIFDSAADAILVSDGENKVVAANPATLHLLQAPRQDLLSRDCGDIFVGAGAKGAEFMQSVLGGGEIRKDVEETVVAESGREQDVLVTASPLLGVSGGISGAVYILRDVGPIKRLCEELRRQATTDELTGLVNRRGLFRALEVELSRARRHSRPLSILMLDLDDFKDYNDANGHLAGDEALRILAGLLASGSRREDAVARYGGEEFVLLLPETNEEQATAKAQRARGEISSHPFPGGSITASIGVMTCPFSAPLEPTGVLEHVDQVLYEAKRGGKNRVAVHRMPGRAAGD